MIIFVLCFAVLLGMFSSPFVSAEEKASPNDNQTFIFYWENDVFADTDRYYTNGAKLIWISGDLNKYSEDKRLPSWSHGPVESVPMLTRKETVKNIALSVGQKIFTPRDISRPELIKDDRPYAGYSYFGIALHSKTQNRLDSFELDIGIVGPDSFARDVQEKIHDLLDSEEPKGWDNQLKNEPALGIVYERKYRVVQLGFGAWPEFDFIAHLGGAAGNVHTYINGGGEIRLGYNLPIDFGTGLIRPAGDASIPAAHRGKFPAGFHLFGAVDGRGVARNIFLDGNTFTDSHEVDKKPFVADLMVGASFHYKNVKITYSHVYQTKEFEEQEDAQIFGSISIAYTF